MCNFRCLEACVQKDLFLTTYRRFHMTEENYNCQTSQTLLRSQFPDKGKFKIPIIPKFQERPGDFDDLLLIGFDKTHLEDQNHLDRMVHFFLYDYRFERVWKNPDNDMEKLSRYRAVLSPDFSMYLEMAPVMQLYNVFRNRWCGALSRKKSSATIHRFPKCRATLSMWITNAVPGGI